MRTFLLVMLSSLAVLAGCKKKPAPNVRPVPQSTQSDGPVSEEPEGAEGVEDELLKPTLPQDDPRSAAMKDVYDALVRGAANAPQRTVDLGADAMPVLKQAIESENIQATIGALKALALMKLVDDEVVRLLKIALDSTSDAVRIEALDTAGALEATAVKPQAVAALADEEMTVRATACEALAAMGDLSSEQLTTLFARVSDAEEVVRAACAGAFARTASRETWRENVAGLLLGNDAAAKEGAVRVLGEWRDAAAFDLIRGGLADDNPVVVSAALAALGPFGDLATVHEVERFIGDERLSVRVEAVAALTHLPKAEVRQLTYQALKDREPTVRLEAASLLTRYPEDPETFIRLHALLRDENAGVRDSAVLALEDLGDPRSFEPLLEHLREETEPTVRANIIDALVAADGKRAIPHLIDRLGEAKGAEQTAVLISLRTITGEPLPVDESAWRAWYEKQHPPAATP